MKKIIRKIKRFHLFLVGFDILYLYLLDKYWNWLSGVFSNNPETFLQTFGIKYTILFSICAAFALAFPSLCSANLLEDLWCRIFKTKNFWDE